MEPAPASEFNESMKSEILQEIVKFEKRPFTISIMGQTGVGKTSLLKALFNKAVLDGNTDRNFVVDHIRPATKEPQLYTIRGENGQILKINDLPGIGESYSADQSHLDIYEEYLHPSDLVIWAIQAENRSTTFDKQSLDYLLGKLDEQTQKHLINKIVFVLTKVDTLHPSPWLMYLNNVYASFVPHNLTHELIERKRQFFKQQFIQPFGSYIVSRTDNKEKCTLGSPFKCNDDEVVYRGFLSKKDVEELSTTYPEWKRVFQRLYNDQDPVPCSAHLKYYLPQLMLAILNRLDSEAVQHFKHIVDLERLGRMSLDEARQLCNFQIWNAPDSRKIFDLENGIFPDPIRDRVLYKKKAETQGRGSFSIKAFLFRFLAHRKQYPLDEGEGHLSIEIPLRER